MIIIAMIDIVVYDIRNKGRKEKKEVRNRRHVRIIINKIEWDEGIDKKMKVKK